MDGNCKHWVRERRQRDAIELGLRAAGEERRGRDGGEGVPGRYTLKPLNPTFNTLNATGKPHALNPKRNSKPYP